MKLRRVTSLTLLWAIALMLATGIVLFIVPHGRVAYWADWRLWGLTKIQWGNVHMTSGLLMLLAGFVHIWLNWTPITKYLQDRSHKLRIFTPEFSCATVLAVLFVGLTLLELPPMTWVLDLNDAAKDRGSQIHGEPPYGHAEESSLAVFTRRMDLDEAAVLTALRNAGLDVEGPGQSLLDIARSNDLRPIDVHRLMAPPTTTTTEVLPSRAPTGLGRLTLKQLAERYGLEPDDIVAALAAKGVTASPADRLKDLSSRTGYEPHDLYDMIRVRLGGSPETTP